MNTFLQIFEPQLVYVVDFLYEHPVIDSNDVIQFHYDYRIYHVQLGRGTTPVFLITPAHVNLPLGMTELLIRPLATPFNSSVLMPDHNVRRTLCKLSGIYPDKKEGSTWDDCWQDLLQRGYEEQLVFAALANPINKDLLDEELRRWTPADVQNLIDDYYSNDGWEIEDDLKYIYSADKLRLTHGVLTPYQIMKYQPHKMVVTNTKVGKSSVGRLNGMLLDRISGSRFLGFSTAKDVNPGLGNGLLDPTYFDEIGSLETIFIDHILNYLEFGEARVEVGKLGIITKGWSCCNFHSNPEVPSDDPQNMLIGLNAFLEKFSKRLDAIGSRIAVIVFTTGWQRARRVKNVPTLDRTRTKALFNALLEMSVPRIEALFNRSEIIEWLERPMPEYEAQVKTLIQHRDAFIPDPVKQLYISHSEGASRHLRGFAFKKAALDHLKDVYFDHVDMPAFLETCEAHLQRVCSINMDSLLRMCSAGFSKKDLLQHSFANLPDYLKVFVTAAGVWRARTGNKTFAPIAELDDIWQETVGLLRPDARATIDVYEYFSKVTDRMDRVRSTTVNRKLDVFGIELHKEAGVPGIRVIKSDPLISQFSQDSTFLSGLFRNESKGILGIGRSQDEKEIRDEMCAYTERREKEKSEKREKDNSVISAPASVDLPRDSTGDGGWTACPSCLAPAKYRSGIGCTRCNYHGGDTQTDHALGVFDTRAGPTGELDAVDFRDALSDAGISNPVSIVDHLIKKNRLFEPRPGVLKRL